MVRAVDVLTFEIDCALCLSKKAATKHDDYVCGPEKMSVRVRISIVFLETPFNDLFAHAVSKRVNKSL